MKIKTNVLNGPPLDFAVAEAIAEKYDVVFDTTTPYSIDWSVGGPVIDRENISIDYRPAVNTARPWIATMPSGAEEHGATPLIAAMRAFVSSVYGDQVHIPEELL